MRRASEKEEVMGALGADAARVHHHDRVGVDHRRQPVGIVTTACSTP
jgi:hypothetical protein